MAHDNAGIFFYGPPPSAAQIIAAARGASTTTELDGNLTKITAKWSDVTLTVSINPSWNREVQLGGIRAWISQFGSEYRNAPGAKNLVANLERTTTCYGSVIAPAYDNEGKVVATLSRLLKTTGGFFFSHQSFYDATGRRIIGLPGDPSRLGPRP
jgi:hypothetical protein